MINQEEFSLTLSKQSILIDTEFLNPISSKKALYYIKKINKFKRFIVFLKINYTNHNQTIRVNFDELSTEENLNLKQSLSDLFEKFRKNQ